LSCWLSITCLVYLLSLLTWYKNFVPIFLSTVRNVPFLILHSCCFNFFNDRSLECFLFQDFFPDYFCAASQGSSQVFVCCFIRSRILTAFFLFFLSPFFLSETDCKDNTHFRFSKIFFMFF